ncbi:MAG TPA: dienelactone hydrolase family protein [Coleofasciculaceae cyanobacterium]|jgi:carboxymethylenebutenolidase
MTNPSIRTTNTQVANGDLQIAAYLAEPTIATIQTFPAIVVLQEIFGVNAHIRDVVDRFAQAGYVAIAPALYQRLAPGYESGYEPEDIKQGRIYKDQTRADDLLADIQSTIAYLQTLPSVKPGAIGCIGFCFGGHVAYLAATLPEVKATASFYGAGIPTFTPGGGEPTIARTAEITGKLYAFFGLEDASIPPAHIEQIEAELQKHQVIHQIFRYAGAEHGFFCDRRPVYNPAAAADAWTHVQALFDL